MQYHIFLFAANKMAVIREPLESSPRKNFNISLNEQNAGDNHHPPPPPNNHPPKLSGDPLKTLAPRVAAKLEEGDFRGAVRIASSSESFAPNNGETLAALKSTHPAPHHDSIIPLKPSSDQALQVDNDEVARAIKSFPCGSAGGPDGLRPQHLKEMIGHATGSCVPHLLRALTSFVNLVLDGSTIPSVFPFFFGTVWHHWGRQYH